MGAAGVFRRSGRRSRCCSSSQVISLLIVALPYIGQHEAAADVRSGTLSCFVGIFVFSIPRLTRFFRLLPAFGL
jgi:hypothetical protein